MNRTIEPVSLVDTVGPVLLTIALLGFLIVLIAIGVTVHKDAKKNSMNPVLWVLVVLFVPNLLGVVIYLIVRGSQKKKSNCYSCGKMVDNDFLICPYCQTATGLPCSSCGKLLAPEWKTCPYCSQIVGETSGSVMKRDKGLRKIILLVISLIVIPITLLVILIILGYFGNSNDSAFQFMSHENNIGNQFEYSAKVFSGSKTRTIKVKEDGILRIESSIEVGNGDLKVILAEENDDEVYEFKQNPEDLIEVIVEAGSQYQIILTGKGIKGIKANFIWEVVE